MTTSKTSATPTTTTPPNLNETESGAFAVKTVNSGTFQDVTLDATQGGSIHVTGSYLQVEGTLTIKANSGASVLLPNRVTCENLIIIATKGSTINSDNIQVGSAFDPSPVNPPTPPPTPSICSISVDTSSTCGLYIINEAGYLTGSVKNHSTLNLWVDFPNGLVSDAITYDKTSVYTKRGF